MKVTKLTGLLILIGCFSQSVFGHGVGHDSSPFNSFLHPWSGADHWFVALAITVWSVWQPDKKARWLPLIFVAGLTGGLFVPWMIESLLLTKLFAIAGVATGLMLMLKGANRHFQWSLLLTLLLGLSQGYQHALDLSSAPTANPPGILLATSLLLLLGTVIGLGSLHFRKRFEWRALLLMLGLGSLSMTLAAY